MSIVKYDEFSEEICVKTTEKEEINSKQQHGWFFNICYGLYKNLHCLNNGSNKPICLRIHSDLLYEDQI